MSTALVARKDTFPFCLTRAEFRRYADACSRLAAPARVGWWFDIGYADGNTQRRYGAPKTDGPEARAYRIGWVQGTRA